MNIQQIIDFLNNRRGYVKEGKKRLQQILGKQGFKVSLNDCEQALYFVRKQIREEKAFREETGHNVNYQPKTKALGGFEVKIDNDEVEGASIPVLPDNMKIKKAWQGANGKMLYSYESTTSLSEDSPLQNFRKGILNDIENIKRPTKKDYSKEQHGEYVLEISLPDLHFGKGDIEDLKTLFFESLINLTDKCANLPISKILLPIGNDGLNSEGMRRTTTKGTPQEDTVPWFDSFRIYAQSLISGVEFLKTIAPVEIIVVQGNHDFERMFYIGELINTFFSKDERVSVDNGIHPRKFVHFDEVLLMYTHGDNEKHSELPIIMATERPQAFANSKHRETHCGHFHKEMVIDEQRGIKTRFLPSICTNDEWHKRMGYESYRAAQAYLWHGERGLEAILQFNV